MSELIAIAYVNWGRWVADCPRPGCGNAEHFGRDQRNGHVGGLTGTAFFCGSAGNGCGLTCRAQWPPNIASIEQMLAGRPPAARNWRPPENLHDLLAENLEHGLVPVSPDAIAHHHGGPLLAIHDDEITVGAIDRGTIRRQLEARGED